MEELNLQSMIPKLFHLILHLLLQMLKMKGDATSSLPIQVSIYILIYLMHLIYDQLQKHRKKMNKDPIFMLFFFSFVDPIYIAYHDEEWGVPVHDDK